MEQVIRTVALWALGSRNPAADCMRLRGRQGITAHSPVIPTHPAATGTSAGIGRSFEDRMIKEVVPEIAKILKVPSVGQFCRVTRQTAHTGDLVIHYRGQVGMIELKNHARTLPVVDRRRFFDSIMMHYKNLNWAILITSRCAVPRFGQKGYTIIGRLIITPETVMFPIAFICDFDSQGPQVLANAITALHEGAVATVGPQWTVPELLERGELSRTLEGVWGTRDAVPFMHPSGAVFTNQG